MFKIKEKKTEEESEEESQKEERVKKFIEYIENESKGINYKEHKDYFNFAVSKYLVKRICETKNKHKNNRFLIKSGLSDLKNKITEMSEDEKNIEQSNKT